MGSANQTATFHAFTPKAALELTSPPSWPASLGPVFVGGAAAFAFNRFLPFTMDWRAAVCWILMLFIAVLMQSAVNTLNDYKDFNSGLDTAETVLDKSDASIVYNQINPKDALRFAIFLLAAAAVLGVVVVLLSNWVLIVIGVLAAAVLVLYSFGPRPISSLPLGEVFSGIVMGGCITVATYMALTTAFIPQVLLVTVPPILSVAMVMLTNNTCDIDRDIEAGRKTLAILLGRQRAAVLEATLATITLLWMAAMGFFFWMSALIMALGATLMCFRRLRLFLHGAYSLENRRVMMSNVSAWCAIISVCWFIGLLVGGLVESLA